jgi:hypothetical protein
MIQGKGCAQLQTCYSISCASERSSRAVVICGSLYRKRAANFVIEQGRMTSSLVIWRASMPSCRPSPFLASLRRGNGMTQYHNALIGCGGVNRERLCDRRSNRKGGGFRKNLPFISAVERRDDQRRLRLPFRRHPVRWFQIWQHGPRGCPLCLQEHDQPRVICINRSYLAAFPHREHPCALTPHHIRQLRRNTAHQDDTIRPNGHKKCSGEPEE